MLHMNSRQSIDFKNIAGTLRHCHAVTWSSSRQPSSPSKQQHHMPCRLHRRTAQRITHREHATGNGTSPTEDEELAIVIVDHGSRRKESNQQLDQFVEMYRKSHPGQLAFAAHMEIAEPSIMDAVKMSVDAGCKKVIVAPYFLSQGRHIQQDIPALVAEAQEAFPDVQCIIADPIGLDDAVVQIIKSRVDSALSNVAVASQ